MNFHEAGKTDGKIAEQFEAEDIRDRSGKRFTKNAEIDSAFRNDRKMKSETSRMRTSGSKKRAEDDRSRLSFSEKSENF
jgi:hypothetical protein